jgi:ATP-dependent Lon protease
MPRDTNTKLRSRMSNKKKIIESSDSESNSNSESDSSYHPGDSEDEGFDRHEYRKFLAKIFPSKHLNNKIKAGEKLKKKRSDMDIDEEPAYKKRYKTRKSKVIDEEEESDEETLGSEDTDEDDEEDTEEEVEEVKKGKFNLILSINSKDRDRDVNSEEWSTCSDSETENEDDPISSDSDDAMSVESEEDNKKSIQVSEEVEPEVLTNLKKMLEMNPRDKSIKKCIQIYKNDLKLQKARQEKYDKKERQRNERIFRRIMRDKNTMNDFEFYSKMDINEQKKIIKELREINKITRVEKPYRLTLLEADIPVQFKAAALKKINSLRHMEPGSGEYYKIKNWVDTFMRIPFGKYNSLELTIENGVNDCHNFMENALQTLDNAVYSLNDAKMQIMQMLGQLLTNPKSIGSAIAIHGPMGTGKTSLIKDGVSKILNRPFAFIALGGATDSSFLEGHGYTYEGSTWGKIVQILIDSKCMNPIIYFDELDKISDTPKGEEIAGILTHLTDTSQNSQFHDKYFSDIDFDLSKCLFIFSYNDESKVNPILKDRMYRIETKGYNGKQKINIANNYLLPKIRDQVKFNSDQVIFSEKTIQYICENFCNKEDGVRNLKRCLEIIHTKLNLYRLMKPGANLFEEDMSIKVEFPFTVTNDIVDKLIKKTKGGLDPSLYHLYL